MSKYFAFEKEVLYQPACSRYLLANKKGNLATRACSAGVLNTFLAHQNPSSYAENNQLAFTENEPPPDSGVIAFVYPG